MHGDTPTQSLVNNTLAFGAGALIGGAADRYMRRRAARRAVNQADNAARNIHMPSRGNGQVEVPNMRAVDTGNVCRHSFSDDTLVVTEDGEVPISEIEVGDTVIGFDEETYETGSYTVSHTWEHEDDTIVTLTIDGEVIETTPWHPFYTDEGWQYAGEA